MLEQSLERRAALALPVRAGAAWPAQTKGRKDAARRYRVASNMGPIVGGEALPSDCVAQNRNRLLFKNSRSEKSGECIAVARAGSVVRDRSTAAAAGVAPGGAR